MGKAQYPSLLQRILANTRTVEGLAYRGVPCRLWTGTLNIDNYPYMSVRRPGKKHPCKTLVHRLACELQRGPPPFDGAQALHRCNVRMCVEGQHLEWGSNQENRLYFIATGGLVGGDEAQSAYGLDE